MSGHVYVEHNLIIRRVAATVAVVVSTVAVVVEWQHSWKYNLTSQTLFYMQGLINNIIRNDIANRIWYIFQVKLISQKINVIT